MANGTAALATMPVLEPPTAPAPAQDKPADLIETAIGEAVASAAIAIAAAVNDGCQRAGRIDPTVKERGATKLAAVAELALDYVGSDADFIRKGREAARAVLRGYFTDGVNPHLIDAAIDAAIDPVFEIAAPIVKNERIYRAAWSN